MTKRITVVPADGRAVPDPEAGDLLPDAGREVPDNAYWRRRLADADITVKTPTKAVKAAKTEEPK
ncbi:DUF2635 domain-containing protein [Pseudomonas sp. P115]|uniref:DUF2635 domain-containing protein n=1 Tax=Pseudomonas pisciculturae TaxID=2730413 RepID=UPI0018927A0B|nr:DUF2635 domain-containing protein [Pseudomonas pisciculturae]MBF6030832.1 DUF2635 domain-containing protein [Pseudomonas pisciculturae]